LTGICGFRTKEKGRKKRPPALEECSMEGFAAKTRGAPLTLGLCCVSLLMTLYTASFGWGASPEEDAEDDPTLVNGELVLNPANTALVHFFVWNLITCHWVDVSLLKAMLMLAAVFEAGSKFERTVGAKGFAVYICLACVAVSLLCNLNDLILFFLVDQEYFYEALHCGHAGVFLMITMGNVCVNIEDCLFTSNLKTRKYVVPGVLAYVILGFLDRNLLNEEWRFVHDDLFVPYSFLVSYALLRQYDFAESSKSSSFLVECPLYSESFTFDAFFPQFARPGIRAACILTDNLLTALCKALGRKRSSPSATSGSDVETGSSKAFQVPVRTSVNPVSERRRQRALEALDQKLAQISKQPEVSLDEDEAAEETKPIMENETTRVSKETGAAEASLPLVADEEEEIPSKAENKGEEVVRTMI